MAALKSHACGSNPITVLLLLKSHPERSPTLTSVHLTFMSDYSLLPVTFAALTSSYRVTSVHPKRDLSDIILRSKATKNLDVICFPGDSSQSLS
jgi:hypothetical protein